MAHTDRFDTLFHALDGSSVTLENQSWRLHLYSIREIDDSIWIQLDVVGSPSYLLTLRQPVSSDVPSILSALSRYLATIRDPSRSVTTDEILGSALMPVRRTTVRAHAGTK